MPSFSRFLSPSSAWYWLNNSSHYLRCQSAGREAFDGYAGIVAQRVDDVAGQANLVGVLAALPETRQSTAKRSGCGRGIGSAISTSRCNSARVPPCQRANVLAALVLVTCETSSVGNVVAFIAGNPGVKENGKRYPAPPSGLQPGHGPSLTQELIRVAGRPSSSMPAAANTNAVCGSGGPSFGVHVPLGTPRGFAVCYTQDDLGAGRS